MEILYYTLLILGALYLHWLLIMIIEDNKKENNKNEQNKKSSL